MDTFNNPVAGNEYALWDKATLYHTLQSKLSFIKALNLKFPWMPIWRLVRERVMLSINMSSFSK